MDEPSPTPIAATLAGTAGTIVGVAGSRLQWEAEMPVADLPAFVARFASGAALPIVTNRGRLHVRSRDWVVWPGEKTVKVRLALEEAGAW
jgi:hypothetical protein